VAYLKALEAAQKSGQLPILSHEPKYNWPRPAELDKPNLQRDLEVSPELRDSLFATMRSRRKCIPSFDESETVEQWAVAAEAGDYIERNSLPELLARWAAEWPPGINDEEETPEKTPSITNPEVPIPLTPCHEDILRTLAQAGHRLTRTKLMSQMAYLKFIHGDSTIRNALPILRKMGLVDNDRRSSPPGFGLTDQGKRRIRHLE
jgi:hypothetical protein